MGIEGGHQARQWPGAQEECSHTGAGGPVIEMDTATQEPGAQQTGSRGQVPKRLEPELVPQNKVHPTQ